MFTKGNLDTAPPWYEMLSTFAKRSPQVVLGKLRRHPLSMRPIHPLVPGTGLAACGQPLRSGIPWRLCSRQTRASQFCSPFGLHEAACRPGSLEAVHTSIIRASLSRLYTHRAGYYGRKGADSHRSATIVPWHRETRGDEHETGQGPCSGGRGERLAQEVPGAQEGLEGEGRQRGLEEEEGEARMVTFGHCLIKTI